MASAHAWPGTPGSGPFACRPCQGSSYCGAFCNAPIFSSTWASNACKFTRVSGLSTAHGPWKRRRTRACHSAEVISGCVSWWQRACVSSGHITASSVCSHAPGPQPSCKRCLHSYHTGRGNQQRARHAASFRRIRGNSSSGCNRHADRERRQGFPGRVVMHGLQCPACRAIADSPGCPQECCAPRMAPRNIKLDW